MGGAASARREREAVVLVVTLVVMFIVAFDVVGTVRPQHIVDRHAATSMPVLPISQCGRKPPRRER